MKMSHSICTLFLAILAVCSVETLQAQSPNMTGESRDMVRALRNPDGTRSIYTRRKGCGMQCSTYTSSGKLAAILDYAEGKHGELLGCIVYDRTRKPIYKVAYGYDSKARLVEERMFSYMNKKLVQRVIYRYDASGNRSKPLIISVDNSGTYVAPTMQHDANEINRSLNNNR